MNFLEQIFHKKLIGLDIGTSGIKAVELSGGRTPRLVAYNRVPLPFNAISPDGEIRDHATVILALRKLFSSKQFSVKRVAVGASGASVMTKKISVPKMSKEELNHQLFFEAEQYIPFSMSEVNIDFAVLGPSQGGSGGKPTLDVLVVAAKKDYIEQLSSLVQDAGLVPEVIDNQAFALGNAYEFNYGYIQGESKSGGLSIIIDFGAGSTKVSVVEGDKTTFSRELRQCGSSCTLLVAQQLGISAEQAEQLKVMENQPSLQPILAEFNATLVEEILRTIDFCVGQSINHSINGVFFCGGASRTPGLVPALEARLAVAVQPLNPIQNIAGTGRKMNAQALRELSYLGAVAIGLSLRHAGDAA